MWREGSSLRSDLIYLCNRLKLDNARLNIVGFLRMLCSEISEVIQNSKIRVLLLHISVTFSQMEIESRVGVIWNTAYLPQKQYVDFCTAELKTHLIIVLNDGERI